MPSGIFQRMVWGTSVNSLAFILKTILICSCLASLFSWKATSVGSPPNFPKLTSQLSRITQPQYFITSLLDPHWTYFWKHYIHYKKDTRVGSQNFGLPNLVLYQTVYTRHLRYCQGVTIIDAHHWQQQQWYSTVRHVIINDLCIFVSIAMFKIQNVEKKMWFVNFMQLTSCYYCTCVHCRISHHPWESSAYLIGVAGFCFGAY